MSRVYNFSAGPAVLPEPVLQEAAAEMLLRAHAAGKRKQVPVYPVSPLCVGDVSRAPEQARVLRKRGSHSLSVKAVRVTDIAIHALFYSAYILQSLHTLFKRPLRLFEGIQFPVSAISQTVSPAFLLLTPRLTYHSSIGIASTHRCSQALNE